MTDTDTVSLNSADSINSTQLPQHQVNALQNADSRPSSGDEEKNVAVTRTKSNKVPLKDKRGILGQLVITPEYEDARDCSPMVKLIIVAIIGFAAITGPMGSSIMLPALDDITTDLNTSISIVNVAVGVYLLALGIFPLWWSAISERNGRRSIYLVSFTLFFAFSIGTALAPNISGLIILRVFQGGCSASVQAVGAGTISDLYEPKERGRAMGWYYLGPLMGPFLAPILGGVVGQVWGWRATQWLLVIFSGCNVILILFFLPETLRRTDNLAALKTLIIKEDLESVDEEIPDEVLSRIASKISSTGGALHDRENDVILDPVLPSLSRYTTNKSTYSKKVAQEALDDEIRKTVEENPTKNDLNHIKTLLYDVIIRPMHSLVLLLYPPVVLVISYSSICFAVIYFFNMSITYEYSREPYNFKQIIVGLLYIPNSITYVAASIIGGRWTDHLLKKHAMAHNGELAPESRIGWNVVTAVVLFPPACLIFGWTIDYGVFWFVPLIGTAIFGFASMLLIGATVTYLVDTLPGKGATGVALNNLIRQILAAIATFVVEPALKGIGPGILFSILMGITTLASVVLIYLKRHGDYYRENYDLTKYYEKL